MKSQLLLVLLIVFAVVGCGPSCEEQIAEYLDQVDAIMVEWDDTVDVAETTPALLLDRPISDLQAIRRDADRNLEPPECGGDDITKTAVDTKRNMIRYMNDIIELLLAFSADTDTDLEPGKDEISVRRTIFQRHVDELNDFVEGS